jgi:RNA polymerase sigma-70 factor (ECF subfamily)
MPDEPEARGLLALMLLHDSRRRARIDERGELVVLEEQDRSQWDATEIAEGVEQLDRALRRTKPGPYQVQAAIAACHATAQTADETDWVEIASLYGTLARMVPSAVVELNRAVAVGMADGPDAGLRLVDALAATGALHGYYLLPATRADFLRRAGRHREAAAAYRDALDQTPSEPERRFLQRRLDEVS